MPNKNDDNFSDYGQKQWQFIRWQEKTMAVYLMIRQNNDG